MTTVLITGASRGLGLEFTRQYLAAGATVIATCRDPDAAPELRALVAAAAARAELHRLDVNSAEETRALAHALDGRAIDILVCNAGVNTPRVPIGQVDEASFSQLMLTNVMGPIRLVGALLENVARSDSRLMVFLSSRLGSMAENARGGAYVYRASKAALNAVVKSLSVDLAPRGITTVLLHPGAAKTAMAGANGAVEVADSVAGMLAVIDNVTPAATGQFFNYDGTPIPW
jgi:NAD(P)-dependent dehydrogenase (short-subunit alcohol dehydrogenase family)